MKSFDPFSTPKRVFRPATDRRVLDLQNAELATAWIMPFVAKCRAGKKEDKNNTDGTIQDLQVTDLFLSMGSQDAINKLRSLIIPRNLIDTPYKDIRLAIQYYFSPTERVVTTERAKFLSVIQGVGESNDDFLAPFRKEARYCNFKKRKKAANPVEELTKIKFVSGLQYLDY